MNIKQAEELTGVSRQNIRFYEKEGLLSPRRDPGNDYRHYSEEDIRTLKVIRALRMLDLPLPRIKAVLQGNIPLAQAAAGCRSCFTISGSRRCCVFCSCCPARS